MGRLYDKFSRSHDSSEIVYTLYYEDAILKPAPSCHSEHEQPSSPLNVLHHKQTSLPRKYKKCKKVSKIIVLDDLLIDVLCI